ncbi:unnamed protein product [Litomosoides sigmodontis]|uniref:Uncharacterized protein n=1 Tax=Litomosoides sigmodontis TaxID=42156 RepID=A0A3P6U4C1_LITSI|nr:unnamed protein product [Litomosoides sigmodontis]VDK88885.1 unnamed protein product [Litomosoides sigmodontis]
MKQTNSCEHICRKILSLDIASYITSIDLCVLLLAWPLQETSQRMRSLKTRLENDLTKFDSETLAKIMTIRRQIQRLSSKNDMMEC